MPPTAIALLAFTFQAQPVPAPTRDPRQHALRVQDALFTIPNVVGVAQLVPDCDGDGLEDLALGRGGKWPRPEQLDLVSAKTRASLRSLPILAAGGMRPVFALGGDLNGDLFPDLISADSSAEAGRGRALLVSGKDGASLASLVGSEPHERLGVAVAFLGDLDGDGLDEFAVGAGQFDPTARPRSPEVASYQTCFEGGEEKHYVVYSDGTRVKESEHTELLMQARAVSTGYVSVRSGKDHSELWRVQGEKPGHAFGSYLHAAGDLDRDGKGDLLVQSERGAASPVVVLSGANGKTIASFHHGGESVCPIGDLDGDKTSDFAIDTAARAQSTARFGGPDFLSGKTHKVLFTLPYPDWYSEYGITVAMGDLDGDGYSEIGFGDADFNLPGASTSDQEAMQVPDLGALSLNEAMRLESDPWSGKWESGCAVIYSGRTRKPIFGVWAEPGSREGLGLTLTPLPDVSGDGWPDVLVGNATTAYVFRGPGPEAK